VTLEEGRVPDVMFRTWPKSIMQLFVIFLLNLKEF